MALFSRFLRQLPTDSRAAAEALLRQLAYLQERMEARNAELEHRLRKLEEA